MIQRFVEITEGQQLEWLLESAADAMLVANGEGRIILANPPLQRMFAYTAAELIDQPVEKLLPERIRHGHVGQRNDFFANPGVRAMGSGRELFGRRSDGVEFPVEVSLSPLQTKQGKALVMATVYDITRRKQAEQQNAILMQELRSANEELTSFAYVVSHDLKAPLRAIGSLADWLSVDYADKFDDEGKEHMRLLISRVHRMSGLIDGILQYSRVGRVKEALVEIDLNHLLSEVIDLLAPPAGISVTIDTALPTIRAEQTRIAQVFQNLLSNAIKYMNKPEGKIHVGCVAEGKYWKFSISDDGPGIEQRHFERIFQLFQTLAPRDRVESTGVGLALVKKIVELYGGHVTLDSTPGLGSTFNFTLPRIVETGVDKGETMKAASKPILLIEDDLVDVMTIRRALKELRVVNPVVHLENGEEALAYLRDPDLEKPCITLLDLNMPVMNGIEFLQVAKHDDQLKRFPVIVLTTSEEQQDKMNSFNLGVAGYMTKPVEYRQFVEVMRSIDLYWSISELP